MVWDILYAKLGHGFVFQGEKGDDGDDGKNGISGEQVYANHTCIISLCLKCNFA